MSLLKALQEDPALRRRWEFGFLLAKVPFAIACIYFFIGHEILKAVITFWIFILCSLPIYALAWIGRKR